MRKWLLVLLMCSCAWARPYYGEPWSANRQFKHLLSALFPQFQMLVGITGNVKHSGGTSPTFVQPCTGNAFGVTSQPCPFSTNVTAGNEILLIAEVLNTGTLSIAGCGITWSQTTLVDNGANILQASGTATSTGPCTITATAGTSGEISIIGAEYNHTTGIDVTSGLSAIGFVGAASLFSCPSVTTTIANDTVTCLATDDSASAGSFTAGSGFTLQINFSSYGDMLEDAVQASPGAVTPTATYNVGSHPVAVVFALKP